MIGTPIKVSGCAPIRRTNDHAPGFGWRMSDQCRRDIESIEANMRRALAEAHNFYFRGTHG